MKYQYSLKKKMNPVSVGMEGVDSESVSCDSGDFVGNTGTSRNESTSISVVSTGKDKILNSIKKGGSSSSSGSCSNKRSWRIKKGDKLSSSKSSSRIFSSILSWMVPRVIKRLSHNSFWRQLRKGHFIREVASAGVFRTFLWLFLCFYFIASERGGGGCYAAEPYISTVAAATCSYPDPVEFASVRPISQPTRAGFFPNGSKAQVDCYSNFRVNGDPYLVCVNGEWMGAGKRAVECELIISNWVKSCGPAPQVDRGYYTEVENDGPPMSEGTYPVRTELQADCVPTYTLNCTHPHRSLCGRISCQPDGRWVPRDGNLITACVAKPVVQNVNGDDDRHGPKPSSSLKNYLILALALVCIFVVAALTVALLRRPLFCKKREQNQGDGQLSGTVGSSQSPNHPPYGGPDLDSLPCAMNTGIFLPGAGYDLQDCQIQDVPFVGTTVFK